MAAVRVMNAVQEPQLVDLSSCAQEPIHTPGSIQPHGVLLALGPDQRIVQASANTERYFGKVARTVLGSSLDDLLGSEQAARLASALRSLEGNEPVYLQTVT